MKNFSRDIFLNFSRRSVASFNPMYGLYCNILNILVFYIQLGVIYELFSLV